MDLLRAHIASFMYADGRSEVTRIMRCCIGGLDVNDSDRLQASVYALGSICKLVLLLFFILS